MPLQRTSVTPNFLPGGAKADILTTSCKQMLQPKYTMNGFEVHDQMTANGSTHFRVLRVLLRSNLQSLQPVLQKAIAEAFTKEIQSRRQDENGYNILQMLQGPANLVSGWISIPTFSMAKSVVTSANSLVFFGEQLCTASVVLEKVGSAKIQ